MLKTILQPYYSCSVQKTARENTKYCRNETNFENWPSCEGYSLWKIVKLGEKLKKTMRKTILQLLILQLFYAKNRSKKHQIFENETILKIDYHAKAIAFAKLSVWVKN